MRMAYWAVATGAALMLAACSAEQRCNAQVDDVYEEYRELHNLDGGRLKFDPDVVVAGQHANAALTQRATRNYDGCVESIREAKRALKRARSAADL